MKYKEYAPSSNLAPFIKCYWSISNISELIGTNEKQFLTEGGMELVFNLGDPFTVSNSSSSEKHGRTFAIGPMTRAQHGYSVGKCHLFGVCFLPGGIAPFLSYPLHELADLCIGAENLWGNMINQFADCLRDQPDINTRIDNLNQFFSSQIDLQSPDYRLLSFSMQIIQQSKGQIPIEKLANHLTIKRRRLERIFQKMVGISPKKMSRIFRVKNAINLMMDSEFDGWAGLAANAGYFDQSHFIRDFKMVTGFTPSSCNDFQIDLTMLS